MPRTGSSEAMLVSAPSQHRLGFAAFHTSATTFTWHHCTGRIFKLKAVCCIAVAAVQHSYDLYYLEQFTLVISKMRIWTLLKDLCEFPISTEKC